MAVLPSLTEAQYKTCDNIFNDFLWNGKRPKIPLKQLQQSKYQGGLKLVNLRKKDIAIKSTWVKTLEADPKIRTLAHSFLCPALQQNIWKCNLRATDVDYVIDRIDNPFWYDVLKAWCHVNYTNNIEEASRLIWYNSLIRIDDLPIVWKKCIQKNLMYVSDLYSNGCLISARVACDKYSLTVMELNALVSALPKEWRARMSQKSNCFNKLPI